MAFRDVMRVRGGEEGGGGEGGRESKKKGGRERKRSGVLKNLKAIFISLTGEGKLFKKETLQKWQE